MTVLNMSKHMCMLDTSVMLALSSGQRRQVLVCAPEELLQVIKGLVEDWWGAKAGMKDD